MSINSKMTALADETRELSGTTTSKSIDAMVSDVDAANTKIAEQTELLEQIMTALEGKAGGPSGDVETCSVTIHAPGFLKVFGWGECTVNIANNIIGPYTMPSTKAHTHTLGMDAIYTFDNLPIGSIFTFYHETKPISNIDVVGNIEYSFANHESVTSATYNFAMCKCNGSGSITITC